MLKADAIILGSPTYFAAVSADLKVLIERGHRPHKTRDRHAEFMKNGSFLSSRPIFI
ncbi:MAG: NAD(P)H-dependent oxidoreductase [Desulfobacterales bacterium]|jgi:multimeric flavodoxin WrbA